MSTDQHVGFSGSRLGMNEMQKRGVYDFLRMFYIDHYKQGDVWLHHGLCIGSDEEAHGVARTLGYKIHGHPALKDNYCAVIPKEEFDCEDPPYSYYGRNQRINHACAILIATPHHKFQKGGTWYTINHTRKIRKPHIVFYRDGEIQREMYDASASGSVPRIS